VPVATSNQPSGTATLNGRCWLAALGGLWIWTFWVLSTEWRLNEQYQYGFAVPFLALYLAWLRMEGTALPEVRLTQNQRWAGMVFMTAGFLLFLFAELLHQQDPMWRLTSWTMISGVTLLTLVWLWLSGGPTLLRAMLLPLAFAWLALPWPSTIETSLTLNLLRGVTYATVQLLNWTGVAALQHGNIIELARGAVGVDTACSGVQSFQSSIMAALFLGEMFRLSFMVRLVLLFGGWGIALAGNFARVYTLTRVVQTHGEAALNSYHDPVGLGASIATFLGIYLLARFLARPRARLAAGPPEERSLRWRWSRPGIEGICLATATALSPVLTWSWFAFVPQQGLSIQRSPLWSISTNGLPVNWRAVPEPFTPNERAILRFTTGEAYGLTAPNGEQIHVFHLFWDPRASVPRIAFSHTPDVCMVSAGWEMVAAPKPLTLSAKGHPFPAALYRFRSDTGEQTVVHGIWFGGLPETSDQNALLGNRTGRLSLLFTGPRRRGHEVLTAFLPAASDDQEQLRRLAVLFELILVPVKPGPAR